MSASHPPARGLATLPALLLVLVAVGPATAEDRPTRLIDAAAQGTFNVGAGQVRAGRAADPSGDGEVLTLDYTLPPGTAAGFWAKGFPEGLNPSTVDVVRLSLSGPGPGALPGVEVAVEIKGDAGVQRIPLEVRTDGTPVTEAVDWAAIGSLSEVVVLVRRAGAGQDPAVGSIALDARFGRLSPLQRLGASPPMRLGAVLAASLVLAALTALLPGVIRSGRGDGTVEGFPGTAPARAKAWDGLGRDLVLGTGVVLIAVLALEVFGQGTRGRWEVGGFALGLSLAGVALAEWLKFGLTGTHLTAGEVFRDALATGLLAASASPLPILQAPAVWSELLLLSQTVAATATLIYHAANAHRLAATGRHLGAVGGALIVGPPYVFGGLLLLAAGGLVRSLGEGISAGALASRPEAAGLLGRLLVVFAFNEIVANGLGVATRRVLLRPAGAHLALLGVATAAVASPWFAAFGSGAEVASWPLGARLAAGMLATMLSQAGLWAEVYLITGMALDALHGRAPSRATVLGTPAQGMRKGAVFSGMFMGILSAVEGLREVPLIRWLAAEHPVLLAAACGALAFPLAKTIIESFDGSTGFFRRVGKSYRSPLLYARGVLAGGGLGYALAAGLPDRATLDRVLFGLGAGVAASAGIDLLRDAVRAATGRGRVQVARLYVVHALLGGFIGAALGFYLDAAQVAVVVAKFGRYLAAGLEPVPFDVYPFVSKWGFTRLGDVTGGVGLMYAEALAGVLSWSVPAWLFAINRTLMIASFRRDPAPIRALLTRAGMIELTENMTLVLRWGLWMSPIINSFLRPMGEPTWYNQDGAIRTVVAVVRDATMGPEAFGAWSLQVFIYLLAFDAVRILIWVDHMGLRVATLVNLSFIGMDRLDGWLARVLSPAATARCIPEAVKRFTTWAPLLVPFYIPRGADWDLAWSRAEALRDARQGGLFASLLDRPPEETAVVLAVAVVVATAGFSAARLLRRRLGARGLPVMSLSNAVYEVSLRADGAMVGRDPGTDYDLSRRSYDRLDPAGRALFLVDPAGPEGEAARPWPLVGNLPGDDAGPARFVRDAHALRSTDTRDGLRVTVEIALAGPDDPAELWTVTVENRTDSARAIRLVPYLEWVLNRPDVDRGHTQYNRLFAEVEYAEGLHAVLAWDQHSGAVGVLASDVRPDGFLASRIDFIGRAGSLASPRVLRTRAFAPAEDTDSHPTFDPIGSLDVGLTVPPRGSSRLRLLIGLAADKGQAIGLIARLLEIPGAEDVAPTHRRAAEHPISHGEVPPGTPQPYCEFTEDGRTLRVSTPFTPRPFDHTMSNALGHVVVVTNRGLHTTASVNAQQNRLTPDWSDIVTREVPGEAFYLYDPDRREWFSPTYHPLNDPEAVHEVDFGVDGTATFRMTRGTLETELAVFVPPDDPAGVYVLTVRNRDDAPRRLRLAPYFQMVLADQPENSGPLRIVRDAGLNALYFENPRNPYRTGPAFVAISGAVERMETVRGRFFGVGRGVAHPVLVERGEPDPAGSADDRPIATFLTTLEIPARQERTVVVVLGQADDRARAEAVLRKYRDPDAARLALEATRRWWLALMDTLRVRTSRPEFDRYLDWLKYQALAVRIWARRGFYQASGAFGFRDQLQDSVNLIWADPAVARRQILLHAAQQFLEGDVVHWFHRLQDGRTGFAARTHASDNLLWLPWAVGEYVAATGDLTLLEERTPYLEAEQPLEPLPAGKHGMGFDPLRSSREETVYRHCLKAIDLVLGRRMGAHQIPLIGTGDWNDGLDEIGSQGRGESVWLGFFLYTILNRMLGLIERREGAARRDDYRAHQRRLGEALEATWRDDRYLRAIHDDGTEIGVGGRGVWEIDALTAAWAVLSGLNPGRGRIAFETALRVLEREKTILLGWPPLREDTLPYLGRSSRYPEGVRENGMYCHGVQWLVGAADVLAGEAARAGRPDEARRYRETALRLWWKISAIPHAEAGEIETYGGQPNQQAADMVTTFDPGRMIWNGYTGAAGWMFRQALEGVLGLRLSGGQIVPPPDSAPPGGLALSEITRDTARSPLSAPASLRQGVQHLEFEQPTRPA